MIFKTFETFINEILNTTFVYNDFIKNIEINFFYEKIKLNENEIFNLESYMNNFKNYEDKDLLNNKIFGEAEFLRFLIFFYKDFTNDNPIDSFYIFVFNGNIAHDHFIKMLDDSKRKYTPIKNYKNVYDNSYEDDTNKLTLNDFWCFPGLLNNDEIFRSWASRNYLNFLFDKKLHEKLGFDDDTWKSI